MKQILSLALALLPCLAWAQYPSNGNQKITLGEQTTADGLIWRGVASDTTLTAKSDTAAYFVLDTVNLNLYTYKASASGKKWTQLGADTASLNLVSRFAAKLNISDTASMLTPYLRKLDTINIKYVNTYGTQTVNGAKTFSSTVTGARFDPTSSSATGNGMFLPTTNTLGFSTSGTNKMTLNNSGNLGLGVTPSAWGTGTRALQVGTYGGLAWSGGVDISMTNNAYYDGTNWVYIASQEASRFLTNRNTFAWFIAPAGTAGNAITFTQAMTLDADGDLGINTASPSEKLHVDGNGRITGAYSSTTASAANLFVDSDGDLLRSTSSIKYKSDVEDYAKGLNEVMKLRPVTYKSINNNNDKIYAGFIAEELADLKLTELYENNDNGEPDAISYAYMVTLLTKAIQQQQSQIEDLKKRIFNLENK